MLFFEWELCLLRRTHHGARITVRECRA